MKARSVCAVVCLCLLSITAVAAPPNVVAGNITDSNGAPLAGVTLTLSSSQMTRIVTSKADGSYGFATQLVPFPFDPIFTLTPLLANYSFSPPNATLFLQPGVDTAAQNFIGTLDRYNASPLNTPEFFVRQQYLDFLLREPDESGLNFWAAELKACTADSCRYQKRRDILCAFVTSGEYQARFTGPSVTVCQ